MTCRQRSAPSWSAMSTSTPRRWTRTGSPKRTRGTGMQSAQIWKCTHLWVKRSVRTPQNPGPTRPGLTEADVAAIREVVRRKAAGFWVEGTTRTTVRKFAHDCIPTGPPVSSQPHSLRGEAAQWVDDRLEEECQRGQLVRGSSAWIGSLQALQEAEACGGLPARERPGQAVYLLLPAGH